MPAARNAPLRGPHRKVASSISKVLRPTNSAAFAANYGGGDVESLFPSRPTSACGALAASVIEGAVTEYLGIIAYRLGVSRTLPNCITDGGKSVHKDNVDDAFASAERFLFGDTCLYDLDTACSGAGVDPDAIRSVVRRAEERLRKTGQETAIGSGRRQNARRRKVPKIVAPGASGDVLGASSHD